MCLQATGISSQSSRFSTMLAHEKWTVRGCEGKGYRNRSKTKNCKGNFFHTCFPNQKHMLLSKFIYTLFEIKGVVKHWHRVVS